MAEKAILHGDTVDHAMPVRYFTARGLIRLVELHRTNRRDIVAPVQLQMALDWG